MKGGRLVRDWDTFKKSFFKIFQDMEGAKIYSNITRLQRDRTMDEYFSNPVFLATRV